MNELQRKVLVFLLKELREYVREMSCDEDEVPGLSHEDRRNLTMMLWAYWDALEEWDGEAYSVFGLSSLTSLAQYWLTGKKD